MQMENSVNDLTIHRGPSNSDGTGPREPPDTRSPPDPQDNLGLAILAILYGVLIASLRTK